VEADVHPARADGRAGPVLTRGVGLGVLAAGLFVAGCAMSGERPTPTVLRYVALGDSYTIGTSVQTHERFPDQLVAALGPDVPTLTLVANLGVNGYTSADLILEELPALDDLEPDFVTVLIGVNDVVRGVPFETYETNVARILDALLAQLPPDRIVTVAIPDYTVTPAGGDYGDPTVQSERIVANNAVMQRLAEGRGLAYVEIFDLSARAAADRSLVASDGLHPSGAQYGLWVERILPVVARLIGRPPT
jgi:acyl-CoA thioesterase I